MPQRSQANSDHDEAAGAGEQSGLQSGQPHGSDAASLAEALVEGTAPFGVEHYLEQLVQGSGGQSDEHAAQVLQELVQRKPELLAPQIEGLVALLASARTVAAMCAAHCLPVLARVTPAKVAKQLKTLQAALPTAPPIAKDGIVRTFVALCVASVTYQKRLIDSFELALRTAPPDQLTAWVEHILPALKGEPYAQARGVVERRLPDPELPRDVAQHIADFLGVKLRPPRT